MSGDRSRSPSRSRQDLSAPVPNSVRSTNLRTLGMTGLQCTSLGLGGASLGDLFVHISENQALETMHHAMEQKLNYFDTAPWYGLGLSESRMGFALRQHTRDVYHLSTKVGRTLVPVADAATWDSRGWMGGLQFDVKWDFSYEGIKQQHRESLHRLGHGQVDCLVIHDMEQAEVEACNVPHREHLRAGGIRALEEMRSSKVIRAFGAGLNGAEGRSEQAYRKWNREYVDFLIGIKQSKRPLDFFLMAGNHTLLNHSAYLDGLLDTCQRNGIGVVIGGAFNSGILATGATTGATFDYEPASEVILDRVRSLEGICRDHGVPLPAAALQYPLGHPMVATVIAGGKSPEEVYRSKMLMDVNIPAAFWEQLLDDGLLPKGAPIPK